jgi:tetratricopeptide (TPR) repeat protein
MRRGRVPILKMLLWLAGGLIWFALVGGIVFVVWFGVQFLTAFEEDLDPNDPESWFRRGTIFHVNRRFDDAIADYSEAIARDSSYALAHLNRGDAYREKGELDRSIADYSKVIDLDPKPLPSKSLNMYYPGACRTRPTDLAAPWKPRSRPTRRRSAIGQDAPRACSTSSRARSYMPMRP